jgi:hypothetical protein
MNSNQMKAFCYRSGLLEMATEVPAGALELAEAPEDIMIDAILGSARLSRTTDQWLVPGVPEANTDEAALDAAISYQKHLEKSIGFRMAEGGRNVCAASS